jgi:membrane protease subunit HflC
MKEGDAIEHPWLSKSVERAQRKVEEYFFQIRKQVLEYDEVMEHQRQAFYGTRQRVLVADAQRQGQILRGQGDAEATRVYAEAFGRDPAFYDFWRSLEAQRKALSDGTTLLLSPDGDFFRFFRDMDGKPQTRP